MRSRPAKVLPLHGLLSGPAAWQSLEGRLGPQVEVVAPDLPGYGRFGSRLADTSMDAFVAQMLPVVLRERPTHLVGHSLGAIFALGLAVSPSGTLEGVGVTGLPVFESRADGVEYLGRGGALMRALLWNDRAALLGCRVAHASSGAWAPLARQRWPLMPAGVFRSAFAHDQAGHGGVLNAVVFGGLVAGLASEVTQPVSALHGTLDRAAPIVAVRGISAQHGWRVEVVDGASHQMVAEEPAIVAEWVSRAVLGDPA